MNIYEKQRNNTKIERKKRFTIYLSNELDKACFQHDMAYVYFKDLTRRTILRDKAFEIVKNPKYDGYQRGLALMVCKCFGKKKNVW